jgi:hypothetical protein
LLSLIGQAQTPSPQAFVQPSVQCTKDRLRQVLLQNFAQNGWIDVSEHCPFCAGPVAHPDRAVHWRNHGKGYGLYSSGQPSGVWATE